MATKITQSSPRIKVKRELCNDEIKDFAETAMNELLGWYGYDNEERMEITSKINLSNRNSKKIASISQKLLENKQNICNNNNNCSSNNNNNSNSNNNNNSSNNCNATNNNNNIPSAHKPSTECSSVSSDRDSSREDSKSPLLLKLNEKKENDCSWCHRTIAAHSTEILGMTEGTVFCSESCFSQSRRATFKRAKTCDWCRHVRHAVSYVDFHDGATQLQFCSDKCLNQYKMQIFCRETQAHLDLNPHLKEKLAAVTGEGDSLITPELWLKNCRSRSPTPTTDHSRSPSPPSVSIIPQPTNKLTASQTETSTSAINSQSLSDVLKKPLISVTPSAKLMSRDMLQSSKSPTKNLRKRRVSSRIPINNNVNNNNNNNNGNSCNSTKSNPLGKFPSSLPNLPDLRSKIAAQLQSQNNKQNAPSMTQFQHRHQFLPPPPPPNFFHRPPFPMPTQQGQRPQLPQAGQVPQNQIHPTGLERFNLNPLGLNTVPPVTVLVPYPIVLPLPIPIPIPISSMAFAKALQKQSSMSSTSPTSTPNETSCDRMMEDEADRAIYESQIETMEEDNQDDQPIDYTKSKTPSVVQSTVENINSELVSETNVQTTKNDSNDSNNVSISSYSNETANEENGNDSTVPGSAAGTNNVEQKLPKFKITKVNSKRILTKDIESCRPLRKRKRIVEANDHDQEEAEIDGNNSIA